MDFFGIKKKLEEGFGSLVGNIGNLFNQGARTVGGVANNVLQQARPVANQVAQNWQQAQNAGGNFNNSLRQQAQNLTNQAINATVRETSNLADNLGYSREDQFKDAQKFDQGDLSSLANPLKRGLQMGTKTTTAANPLSIGGGLAAATVESAQGKEFNPLKQIDRVSDFQRGVYQQGVNVLANVPSSMAVADTWVYNNTQAPIYRAIVGDENTNKITAERETGNKALYGVSNFISDSGKEIIKKQDENSIYSKTGDIAGQTAIGLGASALGPAALPFWYTQAMGRVGRETYNETGDTGKASTTAMIYAPAEAALEKIGSGRVLSPSGIVDNFATGSGKRILKDIGKSFLTEGGTEGSQQFAENLTKNKVYNPNQSLTEGVLESAVIGGLVGGGVGGVASRANYNAQKAQNQQQINQTFGQQDSIQRNDFKSQLDRELANLNNTVTEPNVSEQFNEPVQTNVPEQINTQPQVQVPQVSQAPQAPVQPVQQPQVTQPTVMSEADTQQLQNTQREITRSQPLSGQPESISQLLQNKQIPQENVANQQALGEAKVQAQDLANLYKMDPTTVQRLIEDYGYANVAALAQEVSKSGTARSVDAVVVSEAVKRWGKPRSQMSDAELASLDQTPEANTVATQPTQTTPAEQQPVVTPEAQSYVANPEVIDKIKTQESIYLQNHPGKESKSRLFQASQTLPPDKYLSVLAEFNRTDKALGSGNKVAKSEAIQKTPIQSTADLERVLYGEEKVSANKDGLNLSQVLSPDYYARTYVTRPVERVINTVINKAQTSGIPGVVGVGRVFQGFSREAGRSPEQLAKERVMRGGVQYGEMVGADFTATGKDIEKESATRIWATIDKQRAKELGLDSNEANLTPDEQAERQRIVEVINFVTNEHLKRNLITPEQAANPYYITRKYSPFEQSSNYKKGERVTKDSLFNQFRERDDQVSKELLEKEITDPYYIVGKKLAQSHQVWAVVDYFNGLVSDGTVSNTPKRGYVQLGNDKMFGNAAGKYVPKGISEDVNGFQYNMGVVNGFNDMVTAYDQWGVRRGKKAALTILNPAVRLGNQVTNRAIFSNMGGINPIQFNAEYMKIGSQIANRSPYYIEAVRNGLIGTDIMSGQLKGSLEQYGVEPNVAQQAYRWLKKSYSSADDKARITAYKIYRERGYSEAEAANMTQRSFQDYKSVGFFYDIAAKTPIIGNAFVRFAGDSVRIAKNAAIDHPLRSVATIAMWATFVNAMSKWSGESEEDKKTREDRFGAPKIPFTNISLEVQTPWGAVNVARFLPYYQLNEVGGELSRFLPIQQMPVDYENGKFSVRPESFQDPLLGQVGQLIADTDFRGKKISDPENNTYAKGVAGSDKYTPLDAVSQNLNRARFLATQNIPMGREADALISAATGNPDVYGKVRTLPQALGRSMGVKVEQFGPEQAQKQRDTNKYFNGNVARVDEYIKQNPNDAQDYYAYNSPTRDRNTNTKTSNLVTPERWNIVRSNYERGGKLYEFLKSEAYQQNKENGRPIDPIFTLPPDKVREVLDIRTGKTGDKIEREEILRATTDWYAPYEKSESDYYKASKAFWDKQAREGGPKQNPRVEAYYNIEYPEQPQIIKDYYALKAKDPNAAKQYYKNNVNELSPAFEKYRSDRLGYINAKRAIEGAPPIDAKVFNNVTFGYEDDESKVFKELGFKLGEFGSGSDKGYNAYRKAKSFSQPTIRIAAPKPGALKVPKPNVKKANYKVPKIVVRRSKA